MQLTCKVTYPFHADARSLLRPVICTPVNDAAVLVAADTLRLVPAQLSNGSVRGPVPRLLSLELPAAQ